MDRTVDLRKSRRLDGKGQAHVYGPLPRPAAKDPVGRPEMVRALMHSPTAGYYEKLSCDEVSFIRR